MKVRDCMCGDICVCTPENTVCDCSKNMNEYKIGFMPICDEENNVVGLVTDRDIVLRCIACGKDPKQTKLSEIMSTNVCCCKPEQDISEAEEKMCKEQIKRLPVIDENNKIIGVITFGDLANNNEISQQEVGKTAENICNCNSQNEKHCK